MKFRVTLAKANQVGDVLSLIQSTFAYMEGRIDPPSSMYRLTEDHVGLRLRKGEVFVIGDTVDACMFVEQKGEALYLGKVAIRANLRGKGRFTALIAKAVDVALARGLSALEIESRIELTEVHAAFARQGFFETAKEAHDGFDAPTFIVMRKMLHNA